MLGAAVPLTAVAGIEGMTRVVTGGSSETRTSGDHLELLSSDEELGRPWQFERTGEQSLNLNLSSFEDDIDRYFHDRLSD